ncbi:MAG: Methylase-S domain-containing protein [Candidatus Midichloria mitochondrii]|nr:hypothetical protein [Candidatus Midichloria mitochondrii]MDJ1256762.1 hypothetical protein [Candidatus Midichloria mitochondrii]MDJ1288471.1 hypothetical protein [Candidatus Midichloria mitochondrii]MDJ1299318.1 hypothetical protein [Candidatus Midichloria mitochondrii]MDJ1313438.1 hypothetical protein [Candidatus Midichloria mitochondrii]MDJ1584010.1 hypothetical protein [Candidatus Midichloria mitochondrii]
MLGLTKKHPRDFSISLLSAPESDAAENQQGSAQQKTKVIMNLREVRFDLPGIEKLPLAQEKKIALTEMLLSSSTLHNKRLETVKNLLREGLSLTNAAIEDIFVQQLFSSNRLMLPFKTEVSFRFRNALKAFREVLLNTIRVI